MKIKNQKGFAWPLAVIIIIVAATFLIGTAYIVYNQYFAKKSGTESQQTTNNAGRIYINNKYGFSIKHPSYVSVISGISDNMLKVSFQTSFNEFSIWVYVGQKDEKNIVDMLNPISSGYHTVDKGSLTTAGMLWNKIEEKETKTNGIGKNASSFILYTTKGDNTYILRCINCDSSILGERAGQIKTLFDKMASTFQFTQ